MARESWRCRAAVAVWSLTLLLPGSAAFAATWGANYFPNVPLVTQDGETVHFYDDLIKGKSVVVNFIYTECNASCPLETAKLAQVQGMLGDRVGKDVFFYSISIDPGRDTPAQLKEYAQKFRAGPGWLFLTGKKEDIELVRKKLGQAARPDENELTQHNTSFILGNEPSGQWMQDSSLDDSRYLAVMIRDWLSSWKNHKRENDYADARHAQSDEDRGAYLFRSRCAACHTVGQGDGVGPDLLGVTRARDAGWLARFIAMPDKLMADGDPIALALYEKYKRVQMPNLRLGEPDVASLIGYLEAQTAAQTSAASVDVKKEAAKAGGEANKK